MRNEAACQEDVVESHAYEYTLPIVALGASAGGLEALEQFFRGVSADNGLAYVVVQHLSPDFRSMMGELLRRVTNIPIEVIANGTIVLPNRIYLLPPKNDVILAAGKLLLAERSPGSELNFPIDHFFRSVAQECRTLGVGVVLSGTGNDGTRGICDIHDAGGLVLAQNEGSAKFFGMPHAAHSTGVVKLMLVPEVMGAAILDHYKECLTRTQDAEPTGESSEIEGPMYTIFHLLKRQCNVDFADYKTSTISRRIQRRIMLAGVDTLTDYVEMLKRNSEEVERLYKDLLIGVTGFFRDKDVFEKLEREVIPTLMNRLGPNDEFRAWCVATATGEEAYSLAILVHEYLEAHGQHRQSRIFASDIHRESLNKASRAVFQEDALSGLSEERIARYFEHKSDGFHLSPELRKMVVFVPHNVIKDAPFTRLDLITCRNMLIYLIPAAQRKVLSLFHFAMKRNGILCLGPSETTGELAEEFQVLDERTKIFLKRREIPLPANFRMPSLSAPAYPPNMPQSVLARAIPIRDLVGTYDRLLTDFMPPSVLIDKNRTILHTFGGASQYMRHRDGRLTKDVLDHIHDDLRSPLSAAIRKVQRERKPVLVTRLRLSDAESNANIAMEVRSVSDPKCDEERFLLIFRTESPTPLPDETERVDGREYPSEQFELLERELQHTRDSLQATIEELQTTNEEMQSANEQLIASNEELQSTNEELHSVNEELYTVNAEHQRKIDELTELTDDMDNLLNSTNVHTIFLDSDLRIRRFTPGVAGTFNLIPQDVGRRIDSFTYNILDDHLIYKIKHVLETGEPLEREVRDRAESWFLMRMQPYLTRGKTDGIVITLIDISSLKRAERRLAELSEIVEHSDDAILRVAMDGTISTWNRGAERLFGYRSDEIVGTPVTRLYGPASQEETVRRLRELGTGTPLDMNETQCVCQDGRLLDVSLTLSPIRNDDGQIVAASQIFRDVTIRKKAESEVRESVRHRDQFLAMLSHELRNPLAAVLNATALIGEPEVSARGVMDAREVIDNNVRHLARMLDDLLDVSRYTHDKVTLLKTVVNLNTLALDVVECVRHLVDGKNQRLQIDIPKTPIFVEGDAGRLQQAQVNLLVNASKYTPEGGWIKYSIRREEDQAAIDVEDSGDGIDAALLPRIFEPFVQAEQALERTQGGMGLGLPLVRMIIEAHEGTVAASTKGSQRGSLFQIRLEATHAPPKVEVRSKPSMEWGRRVLLVEDNDDIRRMLAQMLELKGLTVATASDGSQGIDVFIDFQPDVALIDLGLPDVNGYEVAKIIRNKPEYADTMLVAVTGYGRDSDQRRAIAAGFDFLLVKPVNPQELLHAIAEWHQSHRVESRQEVHS